MTSIVNTDEKKIAAMRVVLLGVVGLLWKKKHLYTVIQYVDPLSEQQNLVFDFENKIEEVQPLIYNKVIAARQNKPS